MDDADSTVLAGKAVDHEIMLDENTAIAAQSGDAGANQFLLDKYAFLVLATAQRYGKTADDLEELIFEGTMGLGDAVRDFKLEDGRKFRLFAMHSITLRIRAMAIKIKNRERHSATTKRRISDPLSERSGAVVRRGGEKTTYDAGNVSDVADRDAKTISFLLHSPSPMEEFSAIVRGLPAAAWRVLEQRGYSRDEISAVVGNSTKTIRRKEAQGQPLDLTEGDRTMRLMRITLEAADAFGDQVKALAWMRRPNAALLGKTPLEMIVTEAGTALARRSVGVIAYGGVA